MEEEAFGEDLKRTGEDGALIFLMSFIRARLFRMHTFAERGQ